MSTATLSLTTTLASLDTDTSRPSELEGLLATYNLRLAFGRSVVTGQRVMRLVDDRTGQPSRELPSGFRRRLAGVATRSTRRVR